MFCISYAHKLLRLLIEVYPVCPRTLNEKLFRTKVMYDIQEDIIYSRPCVDGLVTFCEDRINVFK